MDDELKRFFEALGKMDTIPPEDVPTIDLYMDQVTTFMETRLRSALRNPKEDKVLTKTMINNYAKNDLIPPPVKKKYSREHLFELILIFYFKNFLSIGDIQTLLTPLTENYFGGNVDYNMEKIYSEIRTMGRGARQKLKNEVDADLQKVDAAFADAPDDQKEYLQKLGFVCELGYDIFLKKSLIEHLIDEMADDINRQKDADDRHS